MNLLARLSCVILEFPSVFTFGGKVGGGLDLHLDLDVYEDHKCEMQSHPGEAH